MSDIWLICVVFSAPAKGVGRETGARVRVSPSAPKKEVSFFDTSFFDVKNRESNKAIRRIETVRWTVSVPACVLKKAAHLFIVSAPALIVFLFVNLETVVKSDDILFSVIFNLSQK